jgi:hypothetical protein
MLASRIPPLITTLCSVSGSTFPTTGPIFVGLLIGVVVIVGALTYFPALALGHEAASRGGTAGAVLNATHPLSFGSFHPVTSTIAYSVFPSRQSAADVVFLRTPARICEYTPSRIASAFTSPSSLHWCNAIPSGETATHFMDGLIMPVAPRQRGGALCTAVGRFSGRISPPPPRQVDVKQT